MVSYRAVKAAVPDVTPPVVAVGLADHLSVDAGTPVDPVVRCTDTGGSDLVRCATTSDTSLASPTTGTHTIRVQAVDGAGNTTVVTRTLVVKSGHPMVQVRTHGSWRDDTVVHLPRRGSRRTLTLRVVNDRATADVVGLHVPMPGRSYRVRYLQGARDVTGPIRAGTWSVRLASGGSARLTMVITRVRATAPSRRILLARVTSSAQPAGAGTLTLRLRRR
jgi:hypothetical protein